MATGLEYLATVFHCVRENPSQNMIDILNIAETTCHNILIPVWDVIKSLRLVQYSSLLYFLFTKFR